MSIGGSASAAPVQLLGHGTTPAGVAVFGLRMAFHSPWVAAAAAPSNSGAASACILSGMGQSTSVAMNFGAVCWNFA